MIVNNSKIKYIVTSPNLILYYLPGFNPNLLGPPANLSSPLRALGNSNLTRSTGNSNLTKAK